MTPFNLPLKNDLFIYMYYENVCLCKNREKWINSPSLFSGSDAIAVSLRLDVLIKKIKFIFADSRDVSHDDYNGETGTPTGI